MNSLVQRAPSMVLPEWCQLAITTYEQKPATAMASRCDKMPGLFYILESRLQPASKITTSSLGQYRHHAFYLPSQQWTDQSPTLATLPEPFRQLLCLLGGISSTTPSLDLPSPLFSPLWRPALFLGLSSVASSLDLRHGRPLLGFFCSSASASFLFLGWAAPLFNLMDQSRDKQWSECLKIFCIAIATSDLL